MTVCFFDRSYWSNLLQILCWDCCSQEEWDSGPALRACGPAGMRHPHSVSWVIKTGQRLEGHQKQLASSSWETSESQKAFLDTVACDLNPETWQHGHQALGFGLGGGEKSGHWGPGAWVPMCLVLLGSRCPRRQDHTSRQGSRTRQRLDHRGQHQICYSVFHCYFFCIAVRFYTVWATRETLQAK